MKRSYPLSDEEDEAIRYLGGIDRVTVITDRVLVEHGFSRGLFGKSERDRIRRGRRTTREIRFYFDPARSLRSNIEDILEQAEELQAGGAGTNYVGAVLQHLVGAKLDLVIGAGKLIHHGFSVADQSTSRQGDYQIEAICIHVTTHPSEALAKKCADNLKAGLKPIIVTLRHSVQPAEYLLESAGIPDRVDVLDASQFLTANVYERSLFKTADCKVTLAGLLERYNAIVATCETDPSLLIKVPK